MLTDAIGSIAVVAIGQDDPEDDDSKDGLADGPVDGPADGPVDGPTDGLTDGSIVGFVVASTNPTFIRASITFDPHESINQTFSPPSAAIIQLLEVSNLVQEAS